MKLSFSRKIATFSNFKLFLALMLSSYSFALRCYAGESQFAMVYTTDLLPKGAQEIEQWVTFRSGQLGGRFTFLEGRTAYEFGLTDDYQVAVYARYGWSWAKENGPNGETAPPEPFSFDVPGAGESYYSAKFLGLSLENIYRILSPYTNTIGLGVYLEPTFGPRFAEFEWRVLLQKNYLDDTLIFAMNFSVAPEVRLLPDEGGGPDAWQVETDANIGLGASYRFRENWSAGLEAVNENEYATLGFSELVNSVYYLGPTIHYGAKSYFVTLTSLFQLPIASGHTATLPGVLQNGYNLDNDFEKLRIRLKLGFYF